MQKSGEGDAECEGEEMLGRQAPVVRAVPCLLFCHEVSEGNVMPR